MCTPGSVTLSRHTNRLDARRGRTLNFRAGRPAVMQKESRANTAQQLGPARMNPCGPDPSITIPASFCSSSGDSSETCCVRPRPASPPFCPSPTLPPDSEQGPTLRLAKRLISENIERCWSM
ncbi:hypothetical protein L1887_48425 [Cichorium endivia]|nr:hypothetical protein L1887_48425 [Cichorium endivia]